MTSTTLTTAVTAVTVTPRSAGMQLGFNAGTGVFTLASVGAASKFTRSLSDVCHVNDPAGAGFVQAGWGLNVNGGGLGTHDALVPAYGQVINELLAFAQNDVETVKYGVTLSDQAITSALLQAGWPVSLTSGVGLHDSITLIRGLLLAEKIGLGPLLSPNVIYGVTLAQQVKLLDGLFKFFSGTLHEGLGFHDGVVLQFQAVAQLADAIGITPSMSPTLVFGLTLGEHINLTHTQVLKMIFQGDHIADGIKIHAAYLTPSGTYTTWAINTRTGAVTEYSNYVFNSFAKIGNHYIGANRNGLFYLDGERDIAQNIISHIKSGRMAPGGSKFTSFRSAYLGITTRDDAADFVLKMVAADGREYVYAVKPQPEGVVTKVNMGKGLRSRYFSFELISPGADFDLDSIEFIPIVSQRRV